jgi:hypothetical protein
VFINNVAKARTKRSGVANLSRAVSSMTNSEFPSEVNKEMRVSKPPMIEHAKVTKSLP